MRNKAISIIVILPVIALAMWLIIIFLVAPNNNSTDKVETVQELEQQLNEARMISKEFMKLENTLYSKKTYKTNLAQIENITTKEFFEERYTRDASNVYGMADEILNYKYNLDTIVIERKLKGYEVMIYATEVFEDTAYPFTAIIRLDDSMKINGLDKITHKFQ